MKSMPNIYTWHDFRGQGWYLLTLKAATRNRNVFARIDQSGLHPQPLGLLAESQWQNVIEKSKGVLVTDTFQLMADHIHILVHVLARLPWPIGKPIGSFKALTTTLARQRLGYPASTPLWDTGYDWRIKITPEEIENARHYVEENPSENLKKRDAIKRYGPPEKIRHPRLPVFMPMDNSSLGPVTWSAFGNRALLEEPLKAIRVSRRIDELELEDLLLQAIRDCRQGIVHISPTISPGERKLFACLLENGGRVIHISSQSFSPYYHPDKLGLEAAQEGRFLALSPFPMNAPRYPLTRHVAEQLNACAALIANARVGG